MSQAGPITKRISDRVMRDLHRRAFERVSVGVKRLAPLSPGKTAFTVLSMVQPRDVLAYALALRSFSLHTSPARVVVICDPKMGPGDVALLKSSVPHIEIRRAEEFRHDTLPVGGTWERLTAITHYAAQGYVVQLDSDTLSLAALPEVQAAISAGHAFVLGEEARQTVRTREEAAQVWASNPPHSDLHVQAVSEYQLAHAQVRGKFYVRGCAGFSGFPRSAGLLEKLVEFSSELRRLVGSRWDEWGSEQVASNYLAANLPACSVLPFPAYSTPDQLGRPGQDDPRFVHFIGNMRFTTGRYSESAARCLDLLKSAATQLSTP